MCYNVLNFPTGNLQGRADTLANIIDYARPHLLMLQELKTAQGLADITEMMNDIGYGDFAHSTFVPQQSPGSPGNLLQQAIVYDTEVLRMRSEGIVATNYRDINEFVLYLNDPQLAAGADTTFLYVYVTHLKSSTGTENEQLRLEMVNYLVDHFNTLPEDSNVIFSGDFNLYTNTEPAYQAIMNTENAIVMQDPFANYGDWAVDNFAHREILTQCTRTAQLYNDGAGGGVDDRFDFILFSESMMNPDNGIHYSEGSFKSLGNTGLCYNENITDCDTGNPVPVDVLRSIYYMSDHIPQYCELETDILNSVGSRKNDEPFLRAYFYHPHQIQIEYSGFAQPVEILLHDMTGKVITGAMDYMTAGKYRLNSPEAGDGVYLISVKDNHNHYAAVKLCFIE
jgi:endonuclease/exonuclease/phosphatase family metal-dependent hydrolase